MEGIQLNAKVGWLVTPVYNDFPSVIKLIDGVSSLKTEVCFQIIIVDDASTEYGESWEKLSNFRPNHRIMDVNILKLPNNLGNQGAIAEGLTFAFKQAKDKDFFVVMDSDGEDAPQDILKLLEKFDGSNIVVAKRAKRKQNIQLFLWHTLFKAFVRFLIGVQLNFGNFSLLSFDACKQIVGNEKLKVSYVGSLLLNSRRVERVNIYRGIRYEGEPKTSRDGLILTGFLILSVFYERIFTKLIRVGLIFCLTNVFAALIILILRLFTDLTIPGWSGIMIVTLLSGSVQVVIVLAGLIMLYSRLNIKNQK
jgi:polyisoprenyl-phosphate glycosyltransferase